ncbi:MAG TPA: ribosome maturation factor RimP [Candidatus Competibacteraceae bacterium]|nr:ribosome maturation factor RimP [Candidatus Competibacteraceae bacterium]
MRHDPYNLRGLLGPTIEALGYELVGIEFHPNSVNALLRVYIDKDGGITLDDCQLVSHRVSGLLDVEDPIHGHYTLEVSSPGLDRPLFEPAHFERFAGQTVRVQLILPVQGKRKLKGVLRGMRGQMVVVDVEGQEYELPLEQIERARLVPQF